MEAAADDIPCRARTTAKRWPSASTLRASSGPCAESSPPRRRPWRATWRRRKVGCGAHVSVDSGPLPCSSPSLAQDHSLATTCVAAESHACLYGAICAICAFATVAPARGGVELGQFFCWTFRCSGTDRRGFARMGRYIRRRPFRSIKKRLRPTFGHPLVLREDWGGLMCAFSPCSPHPFLCVTTRSPDGSRLLR